MSKKPPALCLAAAVAAYFALWLLVPRATFLPTIMRAIEALLPWTDGAATIGLVLAGFLITAAPTAAFMLTQIAAIYYLARIRMSGWQMLLLLLGSLAGIALFLGLMVWHSGFVARAQRYPTGRELFYIMAMYPHPLKMPMSLCLMFAAAAIGCLVSLRIKDRNLLLPVVMFAACIDVWTVFSGPVSHALQKAPEVVKAVSTPIPAAGTRVFVPISTIGPGDFLFLGLVFAAVCRLGMNGPRNYWFIGVAMTVGMLAVLSGLIDSLPALVVLGAAVVVANWRDFSLTRQEVVSIAVVGLLLAALTYGWTRISPPPSAEPNARPARAVSAAPAARP